MAKFTCYDPNADTPIVIDYALADRELFNEISYFRVKDFTTFSDHCPIELRINADYTIKKHFNKTLKLSELPAKFIWDNHESAVLFRNALNTTAARESINTFRFKTYEYNNVGINYAALDLTNICNKAADIAMIPCRRHKAKGKKKKRRYL